MYSRSIFAALCFCVAFYTACAQTYNSGCYDDNKDLVDWCENDGCSHLPGGSISHEAIILKYPQGSDNYIDNYVCSQEIDGPQGGAKTYTLAYSSVPEIFEVPSSDEFAHEEKEQWYSLALTSKEETLKFSLKHTEALSEDDTFAIIREDGSIYCAFYAKDLQNQAYEFLTDSDYASNTYMFKVSLNYGNMGAYPTCPTPSSPPESELERTMRVKRMKELDALHGNYIASHHRNHALKAIKKIKLENGVRQEKDLCASFCTQGPTPEPTSQPRFRAPSRMN